MLGGKSVDETRMTEGHWASLQSAQRLSFVVARSVLEAFDEKFPQVLWNMSERTQ